MKYFKLTQEQKQKIEDLNKSSKSNIIPQEYKDYWLVDCAYADEPMYSDFAPILNNCEVIEIIPNEAKSIDSPVIEDLQKQLSTIKSFTNQLTNTNEDLKKEMEEIRQILDKKNELQAEINKAMEENSLIEKSNQELEKEIDILKNKINKEDRK